MRISTFCSLTCLWTSNDERYLNVIVLYLEGVGRILVERVALVVRTDLAVDLHVEGGIDIIRGVGQETALCGRYRWARVCE